MVYLKHSNVFSAPQISSQTATPWHSLLYRHVKTAESSPDITRNIARSILKKGKKIFPALRELTENDITSAWSGRVYHTLDDDPFVQGEHGERIVSFAAPSDQSNSLAVRAGQLIGEMIACSTLRPLSDENIQRRRNAERQLKLFEGFPKGARLPPSMRYRKTAFEDSEKSD